MTENFTTQSGYTPCACRDCMDVTVSSDMAQPELCSECKEADCLNYHHRPNLDFEGGSEFGCQRDDVYDVEGCEGHYDSDEALTSGVGIGEPIFCDGSCVTA